MKHRKIAAAAVAVVVAIINVVVVALNSGGSDTLAAAADGAGADTSYAPLLRALPQTLCHTERERIIAFVKGRYENGGVQHRRDTAYLEIYDGDTLQITEEHEMKYSYQASGNGRYLFVEAYYSAYHSRAAHPNFEYSSEIIDLEKLAAVPTEAIFENSKSDGFVRLLLRHLRQDYEGALFFDIGAKYDGENLRQDKDLAGLFNYFVCCPQHKDSVGVVWNRYEIAPYSSGAPGIAVACGEAAEFLTETGKKVFCE